MPAIQNGTINYSRTRAFPMFSRPIFMLVRGSNPQQFPQTLVNPVPPPNNPPQPLNNPLQPPINPPQDQDIPALIPADAHPHTD